MPKNLGRYDNNLSVPRKKDIDDLVNVVDDKYSASNPPPYPVTSVNSQTGAVTLGAGDIGALPLTGGTMSGVIDMNGAKITNVGTPTAAQDAANKAYADSVKGVEVLTQSVEPTTQATGDFWFQES